MSRKRNSFVKRHMILFSCFVTLTFAGRASKALRKIISDQVQIVTPGVKPDDRNLVALFLDFAAQFFFGGEHLRIFGHDLFHHFVADVFPAPFQLFVQDRVRLPFFGRVSMPRHFPPLRTPKPRQRGSWPAGVLLCGACCFKSVLAGLVVADDDSITIVWKTFWASVPVVAVVMKHGLRGGVVPVHRDALDLPFTAVHTHGVVNVDFPLLCFSFKPLKGFLGGAMFWIESLLEICQWGFHSFGWAIDHHLPFGTPLRVLL